MNKNISRPRYGRRFAVAVSVLLGLLPLLPRAAEDEKAIRVRPAAPAAIPDAKYNWGIFVGINSFKAESVAPLRFCANDARSLYDALTGPNKLIPAEQSFLLTSDRTGKDEPTRVNILKTIKYACEHAKEDSLILVSISTHGFTGADKVAYVLPKDGDPELLDQTAVSVKTVNDFLTASKATKKVLLIDACREDTTRGEKGVTKEAMTDRFQDTLKAAAGQVTLASCDKEQVSYEDPSRGHGVFSYYILEGLLGNAPADHQGFITVHTLFQYAVENTEAWCVANRKDKQTPWQYSEISRDIPLAVAPEQPSRMPPVAVIVPPEPAPTKPKPPTAQPTPTPQPPRPVAVLPGARVDTSRIFTLDLPNGQKIEMIYLPGGAFRMGTEQGGINTLAVRHGVSSRSYASETPAHDVTLKGFWIGKTEITNAQYRAFVPRHNSGTYGRQRIDLNGDQQPVVAVSWTDAKKFCDLLSSKTGKKCDLPTEAQWEYAARGGTTTARYFGDDNAALPQYENVMDQAAFSMNPGWRNAIKVDDKFRVTAPVASFQPNPFGLYDMLGNVSEICRDAYSAVFYQDPKAKGENPLNTIPASKRSRDMVLRGGSWQSYQNEFRAAYRSKTSLSRGNDYTGFRIVMEE